MRVLEAVGWWMRMPCLLRKIALQKIRRKKAKWKNDVRPLPSRRESLSIASPSPTSSPSSPSSPSSSSNEKPKYKIPPNAQLDCALLTRLPLELRLEIYAYVFGGPIIHLVQIPRRIAHSRCRLRTSPDPIRRCRPAIQIPLHPRLGTVATANVALLKTCRRIYTEAAHVLYAVNTFDINQMTTFYDFSRTIICSRLRAITSLHISWLTVDEAMSSIDHDDLRQWRRCWDIIATHMWSLRDLKLFMGPRSAVILIQMQKQWVPPLCQVRGLRRFELQVKGMENALKKEVVMMKGLEKRLTTLMTSPP